ncbi:hypothetical protein GCM10027184_72040 [Saccharothrix stipae]
MVDAVARVVEVQRQVGRARLHHREQRHDEVGRPRQGHAHHVLRPHAGGDERTGEPVGGGVQLGVGQPDVLAHDREGVRAQRGLAFDRAGPRHLVDLARRRAELQQLRAFGVVDQVDQGHRLVWVGVEHAQEPALVVGQLLRRADGGVRLERDDEPAVGALEERRGEVVDRAQRQHVERRVEVGEPHLPAEAEVVDRGTDQLRDAVAQAEFAGQVLAPVGAVRDDLADLPVDVGDQAGDGAVRPHGDAQRQHGGRHAGRDAADVIPPTGHRHGQHQVGRAGHAVGVGGDGGDDLP